MQKDQTILITGAAGLIGSCVVGTLNDLGFEHLVLVDDIKKTDKWKNLYGKKCSEFLSKHDLFNWLEKEGGHVAAIIHLGACSDTLEQDGGYLMENNFRYTQRLCKFALKQDLRFIYASSAATYGDGTLGFKDACDQLEALRPLNLYGFSKHFFDLWAKKEGLLDQIVGLKYFNVFGPNEHHKGHMASMVYKMYPKVRDEGVVELFQSSEPERFKDGDQCRDFIYVKDAAKMTCDFLFNNICGIFNIGRGEPTTWNQLAGALFDALGKPRRIEYVPMPERLKKQYQNYTCADMENYTRAYRAARLPVYQTTPIHESVKDYIRNYLLRGERW
jgi:ADP-L-glycero-D-manno-heptose 6-epimerase